VRVIAKKRLRTFWESRKQDLEQAKKDLILWYNLSLKNESDNFAKLKQTHPSADPVGNCVDFDVGNNRYRLIGRVNYRRGIVYVLDVMDHATYDRKRWIASCNCHKPPPKIKAMPTEHTLPRKKRAK